MDFIGIYLSNPEMDYMIAAKQIIRYLKRTKDNFLAYGKSNHLEIIGYSDSNYIGFQYSKRSISSCIFLLLEGAILWKTIKRNTRGYFHHGGKIYSMFVRHSIMEYGCNIFVTRCAYRKTTKVMMHKRYV